MAHLRFGIVSSVDKDNHTVRVVFPGNRDLDATEDPESFDLHMVVQRNGDYALPEKDDQVVCIIDDGASGIGVVLGVVYPDGEPPANDATQRLIWSSGALGVGADGDITISAGNASITISKDGAIAIAVGAGSNVTVDTGLGGSVVFQGGVLPVARQTDTAGPYPIVGGNLFVKA